MRIAVVGGSGNVGTAVLRRLVDDPSVDEVLALARRVPGDRAGEPYRRARWHACDIGAPDAASRLVPLLRGMDAVIHLAWQIQPSHRRELMRRTNVDGTRHVVAAVLAAGVPALVYASSVGTYAPAAKAPRADESWPATGVPGSTYSAHKAAVERMLDDVAAEHPGLRLVRLRPGLVFQRSAAAEITRYFLGPWAPVRLLHYLRPPVLPRAAALRAQAVHADDVADAYAWAALGDARGAFNIAAEPVLSGERLAQHWHARTVPVPMPVLVAAAGLSWWARLQPAEAGWVRMARAAPLMDCSRAATELGWRPAHSALEAVDDLVAGMAEGAGTDSPVLRPADPAGQRWRALLAGQRPGEPAYP